MTRAVIRLGALSLLASTFTLLIHSAGLFESAESQTLNLWLQVRRPTRVSPRITLVFVDDATIRQYGELPWHAEQWAALVTRLKEQGARVIVLNLPSIAARAGFRDPQQVSAFVDAVKRAKNVVLPMELYQQTVDESHPVPRTLQRFACLTDESGRARRVARGVVAPADEVLRAARGLGHINAEPDRDRIVRKLNHVAEFQQAQYPSLALAAWNAYYGGGTEVQLKGGWRAVTPDEEFIFIPGFETLIDPVGDLSEVRGWPALSARDLLGKPSGLPIHGKVVIVGIRAIGNQRTVTIPPDRVVLDTELQALALDNLLERRFLQPASASENAVLLLATGLASAALSLVLSPLLGMGGALIVAFLALALGFHELANQRLWLQAATAATNSGMAYVVCLGWRVYLRGQEDARIRASIETLRDMSDIVAAETDPRQLLESIMQAVVTVLRCEAGSILLLDETGQRLHFEVTFGTRAEEVKQFTLALGEGIAGWVAQHEQAVISNEPSRDVRFQRDIARQIKFMPTAILAAPLKAKDRLFGVVEVLNKRNHEPFTAADLQLLQTAANEAALALENARLYELLQARVEETHRELVATNQRLETERNRLTNIVTHLRDGVVATDVEGTVLIFNNAAARMLRCSTREPVGRPLAEIVTEAELHNLFAGAKQLESGVLSEQLRFVNGPVRVVSAHLSSVRDDHGEVFSTVCVLNDITELKSLEELKDDFVSFVSHELRSPLTSIRGFSSALVRGEVDEPTQQRYMEIIRNEAERMTRLIVSLLDLSRIESGEALELNREAIEMSGLLHEVVERQRNYTRDHQLEVTAPGPLPVVFADRDKVQQILTNLVTNAIKYSPPGSPIEITCDQRNGELVTTVKDEGVGINADDREKIFQRFQRIRHHHGSHASGTGLGLYLTRHLVEAHGGRIWVDSETGRGSCFAFTLPLGQEAL